MAEIPQRRADGGVLGGPLAPPPPAAPPAAPQQAFAGPITPNNLPPGYEPRAVITKRDIKRTVLPKVPGTEPTYWTQNRWGAPARPHQALGVNATLENAQGSPMKRGRQKHYQAPPTPHIIQPDAAVFHTLNDLEALMKATLGALASFNEDERMILTRQFRKEEERARARGEYSPPGLLNIEQFRHAWKKFSVRVSEEQAHALFIKFGHDSQGLLPYDMFATKLLSSPARMLALEPEQKGAYRMGSDGTFKGKIVYYPCKKPVFPPSNWDGTLAVRSMRKPRPGLKLEFVYGYAGKDNTANNLFWTADGKLVYYVAAVGIVYDPETHTQNFYRGHDDDIRCMAMHPNRYIVATGQVSSALDGSADPPFLSVWDTRDVLGTITKIRFPGEEGQGSRYVVALAFSGDGQRLVVVTGDNRHTTYIYHWRSKKLIYQGLGHNGQPPQVYGAVWNNHLKVRDLQGNEIIEPKMFVTYGVKHMKLWMLDKDPKTGAEIYNTQMCKFGRVQVQDVMSACFVSADTLVTGTQGGELLVWDMGGRRAGFGSCIQSIPAHAPGVKAPSIHDGQLVLQGVRALCLRANNTELVSGGSDGVLICWDVTAGTLGRVVKTIQFAEVGESDPCSFRSLDSRPGSYDLAAGTNRCEVWEVTRGDNPEPVVQGHTDDVYACAWHPKKPYKFATVCDSSNVFLWNAKRRQLIAKVNVGLPARACAFSPNGAHLAVGTKIGVVRVLQVESLTQKVAEMADSKEEIEDMKYSPDNTKLAVGSHDNFIYLYDVIRGYARICRCAGHSSYLKHVDWSLDSRILQSNCGAYELLYFEAVTGKQVRQNQRDTLWDTWTCSLGFQVMGIWQKDADGTDINSACRSFKLPAFQDTDPLVGADGEFLVTGGDDGRVRLFNYPCVVQKAPNREYIAHCSHVMEVRFSPNNRWVMSVGSMDRTAMQWRVLPEAQDEIVTDKPQVEEYQVYEAPVRPQVASDPLALMPQAPGVAAAQAAAEAAVAAAAAAAADDKRKEEMDKLRKQNQRTYEITTITSDLKGSGTDARVFCVLNGMKGTSKELHLENGPNNFERGKTDKFTFDMQDIGWPVDRIVIGHNGAGNCPRWHLDKVIVVNKSEPTAQPSVFSCGQWFAKDVGDGQIVRTLKLGATQPVSRIYKIVVKTSDVKGAGTDANVYLTMFGERDGQALNSGPRKLENSQNNFERGQTDTFEQEASIGDLKYIRIGHDNSGLGPSWHLQEVLITAQGVPDKQFVANRWLATDEGDNQTYCVLYPSGEGATPQPKKYRIMVYTSDIRGAGTDARVYITIFGSKGLDTGKLLLENSKNNFERGQEDIFFITYGDLGQLTEVEIEHDNSGPSPGWHCEQVVVIDETTNQRYTFPCDRWLAKDEDDGLIRRRLKVADASSETTDYRVTVYTSDIRGAGTDANVFIELCGKRDGKDMWGPRLTLDNSKNNFERAEVDTFLLKKHKNLGELLRLKIGHDNSGAGPGWHLDHVEVVANTGGEYFFPCQKWFDKKEDDGLVERILEVAPRDAKAEKQQYKVTVHTSDCKFAGTDANVHISLMGELDGKATNSGPQPLNNSKNNFERAQVDVFSLTLPNIGELKRIVIGHDNSGVGADWHLNMVEVLCVNTGQHCRFYYNGWLSKDEAPYKLEVELFPEGADKPPACRYSIIVYTSDIRGAGTDANVTAILFGEKGQTPATRLENSKNNFERGERDEFIIETIDLGKILRLQIGHDDSGLGSAWHLSHVEVVAQATGDRYYFLADQWLDKKLGTLTLTLEPSDAKGAKQIYKVTVQTGDVRGAGTDSDISVILYGEHGKSAEMKLESSADNFERNKTDEFKLDLGQNNLGKINKVDIGFATQQTVSGKLGSIFGQQWNLASVEIVHFNDQVRSFFFYGDWISDKRRRVELVEGTVGENNTYKIVVKTSDIRGAGTDANVTFAMFGEKDGKKLETGIHKLDNSANNFERAATDTFLIKCKDVGEMKRVQITSDGSGLGASWHLDQVEVTDTVRGITVTFPCGQWLDPSEPMSLNQTLLPRGVDGEKGSLLQYEVTVYTSDIRGAGTDSNVSIEFVGDKEKTAPIKLDTSANNFERGAKDLFKLRAIDVGDLQAVVVRKDNSGLLGSDWHLQSVEVWHPALKKRYFFICNDWLKGACEKRLEAGKIPPNGRCTYRVLVTTSDLRGAGTDANVTMTLFGDKGDSGDRKLDSSQNDFERGKTDTFFFECADVGVFQSLRIGHDDSGFGSAWHLAKIEVINTNTGEQAVFPFHNWIDKEHGLSVVLTPDRDGDGKGDALIAANMTEYTITVYTSDMRGAGTDANVFIELFGDKGVVGDTRLDTNANNFERNMKDVFKIKATNVGELKKIAIRHDNAGLSPDWHCSQVDVFSAATNKTYFFPCNAWLKKEGDDVSGLRKELMAGSPDSTGPTNYRVTVYTSDMRGAGTDADVYLVIYGDKGDTGERKLDNSKNNFERAAIDTFFLPAPNVGMMQRIKLRSSGGGLGAAWHLAKVEVSSSATGETLVFPWGKWIDKEHGLEHVLWPDRDGDGTADVGVMGDVLKYRVSVFTSDIRGAGTDANVAIEIHGDKGFVGATRLDNNANNFERGRKDDFEVSGSNVGEITHIVIGHDNSGIGAAWHLAQVEVWHPGNQKTYTFPCNDWLEHSKDKGAEGCKRTLKTGAAAAAEGQVSFRVLVKTSDLRGAGTDADVFLVIYGDKGDTGERPLETGANNFERNMLDTFILKGRDIGEISKVKVRSSGTGLGAAWHLSHIDVISSVNNTTYHFPFNNWVDSKNGLEHVIWKDGVQGAGAPLVDYRVTVYTSDIRGAGTDANVFIELFGDKGSVGQTKLETSANNFEKGQVDVFSVKGSDIGDITKVIISHDNSGIGSAWHCQQVDVFSPATGKTYFFPCNAWLEKTKEAGMDGCRKELVAGSKDAEGSQCTYKVEVKTGNVRGAGTDANVQVCVFGSKGDTGLQKLDDSKNNFERDKLDTFFIKAADIGEQLTSCKVVCDGSGLGAAWFLEYIAVTNSTTGVYAKFPYNGWLDEKAGWSHMLLPEGQGGAVSNIVEYQVTVVTSDVRGAGTDGEVFLALKGDKGEIGETVLENARNNFERNQTDTFLISGTDIGTIKEARVRLLERGVGGAWHLSQIEVLNKKTGAKALFVYNNWLEKTKTTPDACVTLYEASTDAAKAVRKTNQWKVVMQTGNMFGAGTDANVFVQIYGPNGLLGGSEMGLDNSKNNFERGQLDTFVMEVPVEKDCGAPLVKFVVDRGTSMSCSPDWNLDWVEVTDVSRGHVYKWRCGSWFNSKEGLKKEWSAAAMVQGLPQPLELIEAPGGVEPAGGTTSVSGSAYQLRFKTGEKFGAGTDATVRVEFTDEFGAKWKPMFPQEKAMFERGMTDEFMTSSLVPLGEIVSARLWLENSGLGDAWFLDYLELQHLPSQRAWKFSLGNWLPKEGATIQATILNNVPLTQPGAPPPQPPPVPGGQDTGPRVDQQHAAGAAPGAVPAAAPAPQGPPPRRTVQYEVVVHTGTKYGAGTDAIITACLSGSLGTAVHTFDQNKALFESGSVDRFMLRLPDCGDLQSIKFWHNGGGFGSDWYLAKVVVEALGAAPAAAGGMGTRYEATFNAWIKGKGEAAGVARPLVLLSGMLPSQTPEGQLAAAQAAGMLPPPQQHPQQARSSQPGDPGIAPQVLDEGAFKSLPAMQQPADTANAPDARRAMQPPEPRCDWQKHTAPYAQDPRYQVTYYYNVVTGASTYDKPPEFAEWEKQYDAWLARTVQ